MKLRHSLLLFISLVLLSISCSKEAEPTKSYFEDGEWTIVKESDKTKPAVLVFIGDGYLKDDFEKENGKFISDVKEGVREFFAVEPYKTYANYFKVYAIAAYSEQNGMSYEGQAPRRTRFGVTKHTETALTCQEDTVFNYIDKVPALKGKLDKIAVILLSNASVYAGTCLMYLTGESIAIVPVFRDTTAGRYYGYANILLHEAGGHGFGGCADEYILNAGQTIPTEGEYSTVSVMRYQAADLWNNICITDEVSYLPWKDLVGLKGYEAVTNPEGGLYYEFGVWRSEAKSCMTNNMPYFSAAQRLSIVKHIKALSDEPFSLSDFIQKDVIRKPDPDTLLKTTFCPTTHIPLGRPRVK